VISVKQVGRVPGSNLDVGVSCSSWGVSWLTRLLLANAGAGLQIVHPFQLNPLNPLNQLIHYCIRILCSLKYWEPQAVAETCVFFSLAEIGKQCLLVTFILVGCILLRNVYVYLSNIPAIATENLLVLLLFSLFTIIRTKLHGLSPRANYTDRATAACRRSDCQLVRMEGATWSA
jgi:hypothetical protein